MDYSCCYFSFHLYLNLIKTNWIWNRLNCTVEDSLLTLERTKCLTQLKNSNLVANFVLVMTYDVVNLTFAMELNMF